MKGLLLFAALVVVCHGRFNREVMSGDYTRLFTPNLYDDNDPGGDGPSLPYNQRRLNVYGANWVAFKVKACNDARILLHHSTADVGSNELVYEIILGGWSNTQCAIREQQQGSGTKWIDTPGILSCSDFRTFWLHWSYSYIELGYGPIEHESPFMRMERMDRNFEVNFLSVATGWGSTGVWEFMENSGYRWTVHTPASTPLEYQVITKSTVQRKGFYTFEFKGCGEAHIALGSSPQHAYNDWSYHVVLGAYQNTKTCIVTMGDGQTRCDDAGPSTDCDKWYEYWISWQDKTVAVGYGAIVGQKELISYFDPSFTSVGAMSFATGWSTAETNYDGDWVFEDTKENRYWIFYAPGTPANNYNFWLTTPRHHRIIFRIRACKDARMAISCRAYGDGKYRSFEIQIGANENTQTLITDRSDGGKILASADTPNILRCTEMQNMWLRWSNNILAIGTNTADSRGELVSHEIPPDYGEITTIGIGSPAEPDQYWSVVKSMGDESHLHSYEGYENANWISVEEDLYKVFRVKACQNVQIVLAQFLGRIDTQAHEVIIGLPEDGAVKTVINHLSSDRRRVAERTTPDVLDCDMYKEFWVSWYRDQLEVGMGHRAGHHHLLTYEYRVPHPVYALSYATSGAHAEVHMENDVGDAFYMNAMDKGITRKWSHLETSYHWIYFMLEASSARLILTNKYHSTSSAYYFYLGDYDNTQTTLYRGSKHVAHEVTPNAMDATQMQSFWVSWRDGLIEVGKGKRRGQYSLLSWKDSKPYSIHAAAVTTLSDERATFKFYENAGMREFTYDTRDTEDWSQIWLQTSRVSHVFFTAKACSDVKILLSPIMFSTDHLNNYVITIDGWGNTSMIEGPYMSNHGNRTVYTQRATSNRLSCGEERYFWLLFDGGHLAVGGGERIGHHVIISHHDFDPLPIRGVAFSTANGVKGEFRYTYSAGGFQDISYDSSGLSGGEVAGAVIGFLALFTLFGAAMFVLIRPPEALKPYILPPETSTGTRTGASAMPASSVQYNNNSRGKDSETSVELGASGLDNPMYGDEESKQTSEEVKGEDLNLDKVSLDLGTSDNPIF